MAKLSKEQARKAIEMKNSGETYRDIEEKLVNEYGKENVPNFSNISTKIKPVLDGEKTLDEMFSEEKEEPKEKKEKTKEQNETDLERDLEVDPTAENKEDNNQSHSTLIVLWVIFSILVILTIIYGL